MADQDQYKPKWPVSGLSISRDANGFSAKWNVPRAATDDSKDNCYTGIWLQWRLNYASSKLKALEDSPRTSSDTGLSSSSQPYTRWKGDFKPFEKKSLSREAFYPCVKEYTENGKSKKHTGRKVSSVSVTVKGFHRVKDKGRHYSDAATATYSFKPPLPSTVEWTYDADHAEATVKVKAGSQRDLVTGKKTDVNEHYDTNIVVSITKVDGKDQKLLEESTLYKEWEHTFDISSYLRSLREGKGVKLTCTATPRGIVGDGDSASESLTVGMPMKPAIKEIAYQPKRDENDPLLETGRVVVTIDTGKEKDIKGNYKGEAVRTDEVKLQRRHGEDGSPEDVDGAVDDSGATKLYDSIGAIWPSGVVYGEKVYYRVVSSDSGYSVYGEWVYAKAIFREEAKYACNANVEGGLKVSAVKSSMDYVKVKMSWVDGTDNDGCELSWSNHNDAWKTGSGPSTETYEAGGKKGSETTMLDLPDPSQNTFLRFRRYRDVGDKRYFSGYSEIVKYAAPDIEGVKCGIISAVPSTDGTSATVTVGWLKDDNGAGTELSWSTSRGAWTSDSEDMSTAVYTAEGGESKSKEWSRQADLTISSLTQGETYYVRARRFVTVGGSDVYGPYSEDAEVSCESAEDDVCFVGECESDASGTGAEVTVYIDEDNENTGTEVAWSTDRFAFQSNEQPSTMQATWPVEDSADPDWPKRQVSYLRGLEPGTKYYVWARRYLEAGGTTTYGPWSKPGNFRTADPEVSTAADDTCEILDVTVDESGTGATVVVGWTEDNVNDGTELSWSKDPGAWRSNEGPITMQADWKDTESRAGDYGADYVCTQVAFVRGLELGSNYTMRARRYLGEDGSFSEYSKDWSFTTPSEAGGAMLLCGIVDEADDDVPLTRAVDGDTVRVVVGWDGDRTGCEVTWSSDPDAWESSEQPESFEFEWADGESQAEGWFNTGTVYVSGLEDGVPCYFRARSYYEVDGNRIYSDYSEPVVRTPFSAPDTVTLAAPSSVARGEAIEAYWSISGELEQVEWHIHEATRPNVSPISGEGSLMHASIPADRYSGDSFSFYVEAGCGGGLTASNTVTVAIADAPSCECACGEVLEAQPATFEVYTDNPRSTVLATCRSQGITYQMPDGSRDQLYQDTVWTEAIQVSWTPATWGDTLMRSRLASLVLEAQADLEEAQDALDGLEPGDEGYQEALAARDNAQVALDDAEASLAAHPAGGETNMAEVSLPSSAYLVDGGTYTVDVRTQEPVAGLRSEAAQCAFSVAWEHQAPTPDDVEVEVDLGTRSVSITFGAASGMASSDVYDLYRATDTGYELCLGGIDAGATVNDPYAPFGDASYRVACRTVDGDVAYDDFAYSLPVKAMRFDWPGGSVELPYNVELSDSYEKSFEARDHVDGTVNGYYDRAVHRTGSYQASIVKADSETIASLRSLGEHPGAAFCRTASGSAFQCNADLGGIDLSYASMAAGVSIPITAMRLTSEYMASAEGVE